MSAILGSTETGTTANKAFSTHCDASGSPMDGFRLSCDGVNTENNNDGTVGVIFSVTIPSGYDMHRGDQKTGSWSDGREGQDYDLMKLGIDKNGGAGGTYRFEVWFSSDILKDGTDWQLPWEVSVFSNGQLSGGPYTYTFKKGGSGGGHRH
jgi:hypothetical protein